MEIKKVKLKYDKWMSGYKRYNNKIGYIEDDKRDCYGNYFVWFKEGGFTIVSEEVIDIFKYDKENKHTEFKEGDKIELFLIPLPNCQDRYEHENCSFVSINKNGIIVNEYGDKIYYPNSRIAKIRLVNKNFIN